MQKKSLVTLRLLGLQADEKERFAAILSLAERRLNPPWSITDNKADFFVLPYRFKPEMGRHKQLKTLPIERCIFCANKTMDDSVNILDADAHNTPRLGKLVELFNALSENLTTDAPVPNSQQSSVVNNYFNSQQGLLKYLLNDSNQGVQSFSLKNQDSVPKIYIDFENKRYYSLIGLEDLSAYFIAPPEMQSNMLSQNQFTVETASLLALPLNNLIYYVTLNLAQGLPPQQNSPEMFVRLRRWPDLKLSGGQEFIRIATFMQSNSTNLVNIAEKTATPLAKVYDFYHACLLIGLIENCQQADTHDKKNSQDDKDLFSQISERLNELNNKK